jgi:D-sedoheptulose 7-phosphate isomerase
MNELANETIHWAMQEKVLRKSRESAETKERFFSTNSAEIVRCSHAMADALAAGGKLFVMGNGGSFCDAQHVCVEFMHPIIEKRPAFPALALATDSALLTAVSNDQDYALAFSKQLKMLAKKGDIALGISTSGKSASVNRAIQSARELGLMTIGFSGRDGGRLASLCDYCFTVPSFSIHRIQETHETLLHILWDLIHVIRGEEDVL